MKRKLVSFVLTLFIVFNFIFCSNVSVGSSSLFSFGNNTNALSSSTTSDNLEIYADSCLLLDVDSSKILYEKNAYERMYPASTTKLMTAIIVLEKCPDLSKLVNVSYYAVHSIPYTYSVAELQPNEKFTVKDLLYALMVASANDAAYVLAQYVANGSNNYPLDSSSQSKASFDKSIETFSNMMNEKAKELGCQDTHFVNPNGIHNENHYSTSYDLSLIGKYAYSNIQLMSIVKALSYKLNNSDIYTKEERTFTCTNALLNPNKRGYYKYANGLKTGYTDPALSCIIASAKKDNRNLIATVLHSPTTDEYNQSREADCIRLFEYGFNNFTTSNLVQKDEVVRTLNILNGTNETKSLNILTKEDLSALIRTGEAIDVTPSIKITKYFAPIAENEVIGTITYNVDGVSYSSDLIAEHDVVSDDYMYLIWLLLGILALLFFVFTIIFHNKSKY